MSELRTEEEQIEAFKNWWKKNGTSLVLAVAVGVGGYFGWQAWQTSQANHMAEASSLYQSMMQSAADLSKEENQKSVRFVAKQLADDYADTGYAMFAQLLTARVDAQNGDYDAALAALRSAKAATEDTTFKVIADIRIARLLAEQKNYGEALAVLGSINNAEFTSSVEELKGDILLAQGKRDDARAAYEKATSNLNGSVNHPLLDIKLKDLVNS